MSDATVNLRKLARETLTAAQREPLDCDAVATLFAAIQAVCARCESLEAGAQEKTLREAEEVAAIERTLPTHLPAGQRIAALMARTGKSRSAIYRLRDLARDSRRG